MSYMKDKEIDRHNIREAFRWLRQVMNQRCPPESLPNIYLPFIAERATPTGAGDVLAQLVFNEARDIINAEIQNRADTTREGANGDETLPPESYDLPDLQDLLDEGYQRLVHIAHGGERLIQAAAIMVWNGKLAAPFLIGFLRAYPDAVTTSIDAAHPKVTAHLEDCDIPDTITPGMVIPWKPKTTFDKGLFRDMLQFFSRPR